PGFFRSDKSLIQIIGRASRNINGHVVMYGDQITDAMKMAISETTRRRNIQLEYNQKNNITPKTIIKNIPLDLDSSDVNLNYSSLMEKSKKSKLMRAQTVAKLRIEMLEAAKNQEYERAIYLRDIIMELESGK
ncbi:MAG: UvrB/UvrC motif-containing protein, partial [Malacoplasma sp.]